MQNYSPKKIVDELNRFIIGQDDAKRAVAVALRNRYRRSCLTPELRDEITPKNIIMVGPTGCGKTEIARRLAKLVDAPFVKVEATKFTEVGYVGRDVDSIIRDLVEASVRLVKSSRESSVRMMAEAAAEQRLVKLIVPGKKHDKPAPNPIELLLGAPKSQEPQLSEDEKHYYESKRDDVLTQLRAGRLEDDVVEVEVEETPKLGMEMGNGNGIDISISDMMGDFMPKRKKIRKMKVCDARKLITQEEIDKLIDMDDVISEALERAEQDGIVFIDEIDKIAASSQTRGPDVSREGVQRDILPIVEGSTVSTKYGPVKTDYILFIAAGAFHVAKVTDLIPELQGRFPITVDLKSLSEEDFRLIMIQPENAITKQYKALLEVDNIDLVYTDKALAEIAHFAFLANETKENIGARRLHTVMETLLEDISFNATGDHPLTKVEIDENFVAEHLDMKKYGKDLKKYLL